MVVMFSLSGSRRTFSAVKKAFRVFVCPLLVVLSLCSKQHALAMINVGHRNCILAFAGHVGQGKSQICKTIENDTKNNSITA